MWRNEREEPVRVNWMAILSIGGSLAASLALWTVLIRGIQALLR